MASDVVRNPPADNRLALQPARSYAIPGGPHARDLGEVEVAILAEVIRGGDDDGGAGSRR